MAPYSKEQKSEDCHSMGLAQICHILKRKIKSFRQKWLQGKGLVLMYVLVLVGGLCWLPDEWTASGNKVRIQKMIQKVGDDS